MIDSQVYHNPEFPRGSVRSPK